VADVHFNPNVASVAAGLVEKVRVNPGNFVDKKKFEHIEYNDTEYELEIVRIREKFVPLIHLCKEHHTALRIGTNHGSLSDRILSRFGDTAMGMVESAMEFLRMCVAEDFTDVVLSMKSSNTQVMVQAYRLLVVKMQEENMFFPLHLGVTEAGEGEDGRVKSAVGIGALLADGLGDTIRVSLTEDPELEIPVALSLVRLFADMQDHRPIRPVDAKAYGAYAYNRFVKTEVGIVGGDRVPIVIADLSNEMYVDQHTFAELGYVYDEKNDKWSVKDQAPDFVYVSTNGIDPNIPPMVRLMADYDVCQSLQANGYEVFPVYEISNYYSGPNASNTINFVRVTYSDFTPELYKTIAQDDSVVLLLETKPNLQLIEKINSVAELRAFCLELENIGSKHPIVFHQRYYVDDFDTLQLHAASETGILFIDGMGDGLMMSNLNPRITKQQTNALSFNILQASRVRVSKTEYISCPSCGRTLFNLQETTARIRKQTAHLKGLKIGIMGCIVNGPGEMADAHYGYVGTGPDKVTLYRGKEVVKRNLDASVAVDSLIELIKEHGDWIEPLAD
jgi:(E)-4-hydroxy-3-methylbut-2-enyl-diphosphate synthase